VVFIRRLLAVAVAVLVAGSMAAGCSGSDDGRTGVEFGRGELPQTVPEDFPVPEAAAINSTLIDWDRDRTEVNMIFPAELTVVARFFDENLANRGYLVESSTGSTAAWSIVFSKDTLDGDIALLPQSEATTAVTVEFVSR
jgi:hypothetical protein